MRTVRFSLCLMALAMLGILTGCGPSPPTQSVKLHAPSVKARSTPVGVTPTALPFQTVVRMANPTRLLIPAIGVNAHVESVGILSNGDLATLTPTQSPWENVGWYNGGPRPGERGSAVIDGHLDRPHGYPAVFWYLRDLHIGDTVLVMNADRKTLHFHVTRIAFYTPQDAPIQDIFGNNGGIYLNLITCAGDWIPSQLQTTLRLVVYTALG